MNIKDEQILFGNNFSKLNFEKEYENVELTNNDLQSMNNIFDNPQKYLNELKNIVIPLEKRKKFNGKTLLCAWLTKLCPANVNVASLDQI